MDRHRWLALACVALAAGLATNALLGPLATGIIEYRYTETYENQGIGLDAFALAIGAPLLLAAAALTWRRHVAGPLLALGPSLMSAYMMPQYVLGAHFDDLPGNNEDFFLLHLGLFILSAGVGVLAWTTVDERRLPVASSRYRRYTGGLLFAVTVFLILRYLPALADIWRDNPSSEYLDDPIAFWLIAFMDLGIVMPVAAAGGIALLAGVARARKVMFAVVTWFALVGPAVASMAYAMDVNDDPNASRGGAIAFTAFSVSFVVVAMWIYRPLFRAHREA
ncbi:MAG: hypothetical protein Kow0010_15340 [Dehalococcoidia bacterium]